MAATQARGDSECRDDAVLRSLADVPQLARELAATPMGVINVADDHNDWFRAVAGPYFPMPRQASPLFGPLILQRTPRIVPDTLADGQLCRHPLVTGFPHVRFYAGFPLLLGDGTAVGNLSVVDQVSRQLSDDQIASLERLAGQTALLVDLHRRCRRGHQTAPAPVLPAAGTAGRQPERLVDLASFHATLEITLSIPTPPPFALLRCHLRKLPRIAASFGDAVAEQVMEAFVARLLAALPGHALAARHGESQLLVLLPEGVRREITAAWADRLIAALELPLQVGARAINVGIAIGIAQYGDGYRHPGADRSVAAPALLADASIALGIARAGAGSNHCFIDPVIRAQAQEEVDLEQRLRDALAEGTLQPHLQPLVDLASGAPLGFECLVRWRDPGEGWISPGRFLPLAYRTGLAGELDLQMIQSSLNLVPALTTAMPDWPLLLSVNISTQVLEQEALRRRLLAVIEATPLPPSWSLQLELIEDDLHGTDVDGPLVRFLQQLVQRGITLAIDDFGAGHSWLSRLRTLPFRALKVDGSFVRSIDDPDQPSNKLLKAIVTLSQELGLATTAEGIETEAQRQWLLRQGIPIGQGYLFARPLPLQQALAYLRSWRGTAVPPALLLRGRRSLRP